MADRDEAKFRPEKSTWKGLSLKVLQSRIADPATILIAGVAAVLAFGVATTMTKAPVGSALAPLRGAPDSTGASRFLIDAYPMPGGECYAAMCRQAGHRFIGVMGSPGQAGSVLAPLQPVQKAQARGPVLSALPNDTARWMCSSAGPMPFENLSRAAQREFTLDGQVEVVSALYVDRVSSNPVWTKQVIARNIAAADRRDPKTGPCTYFEACNSAFYEALEAHPVQGQNVLVVGSLDPWVEAICLSFKANSTTTVDFNPPKADDPRMRVWSIAELDSSEEVFDAILSYSSLEHDGLGRYGDPINPFGDLQRLHKLAVRAPHPESANRHSTPTPAFPSLLSTL